MNNIRVLFIVAALPALLLLGFIYYRDRKEKPPVKLMILLFGDRCSNYCSGSYRRVYRSGICHG